MAEELPLLSEREMEILRLVATGATNQEIARKLFISVNTVKVHLRNIFYKLEVTSRTEATMVAVRRGWVAVPQASSLGVEEGQPAQALTPPQVQRPRSYGLPVLERWPQVHWVHRVGLVLAVTLALLSLFLPQVLEGRAGGQAPSAIRDVFPTPTSASGSSADRWHTRAQMPTPRNGLATVAYDGLIYAIGGVGNEGVTGRVEVYEPKTDSWSVRRSKPTPVGFVSGVEVGGWIYVPGGIGADQVVQRALEIYDPARDVWMVGAPLPEARSGYALAALADQIYLFGGLTELGYANSVYHYDPQADRWDERAPMAEARGLMGAAVLGERIYVVGGYSEEGELGLCSVYDPATDRWTACRSMTTRRGGLGVVAVRNHLYAIGGGMGAYLAFNERYDPRSDLWGRIETPVYGQWRGLGVAFVDPYVYAIGGWNEANLAVNEAYQALFYQMFILP